MRNRICTLLLIVIPLFSKAQINNTINGITLNLPCELEYKRTILNQKSYNCVSQDINEYVHSYDFNISDLSNDLSSLNEKQKNEYKASFLNQIIINSKQNGEYSEYFTLNGVKAISVISYIEYDGLKLMAVSIYFIHNKNSIIINHVTNIFDKNLILKDLKKQNKILIGWFFILYHFKIL